MKLLAWKSNPIWGVMSAGLGCLNGCSTTNSIKNNALIAMFVETKTENPELARRIEWFQSDPRSAWLEANPVFQPLQHMEHAEVIKSPDGVHSIHMKFNTRGKLLLEDVTAARVGRRFFLMAWYRHKPDDKEIKPRCIGVKYIEKPNSTGQFVFLPDTSEEEARRLTDGFNSAAKKIQR